MRRHMAIGAVALVLGTGGAALAHAQGASQDTTGGLSISPAIIVRPAQPGSLGVVTVANRSAAALNVRVAARPWAETATAAISADRKKTLPGVTVSKTAFTLAPGASQDVNLALLGAPAGGALYGAVEVIGLPTDVKTRKGIVVGYRLIGTLRLTPAARRLALVAGAVKVTSAKRAAALPLKNNGNTLDAVKGSIKVTGATGTHNIAVDNVVVLPGKQVSLSLGTGMQKGSYTASVSLTQAGKKQPTIKRKFAVR